MAENEQGQPTKRGRRTSNRPKKAKDAHPEDATGQQPEPARLAAAATPPAESTSSGAHTTGAHGTPAEQGASERTATAPAAVPGGPRLVMCAKLGRELPGLDRPPFPGELGRRIYEHISRQAWEMWQEHSTLLINHYGLNLADPDARQIMRQQMEEFFFGPGARMPEGWVPESAGAKGKGSVARRK